MIDRAKIKEICRVYGIYPKHDAGQNFLLDTDVVATAVEAGAVASDDTVVEIGPGLGVLTEQLVTTAGRVIAIERDETLVAFLKAKFFQSKQLELVQGDALRFTPAEYNLAKYKVVANIPYNITSPLLKHFLSTTPKPESMTILVQREVAQRICARPGQMSLLAISVQLYGTPSIRMQVHRKKFWPEPRVDSSILHIANIQSDAEVLKRLAGLSENEFWWVLHIGFASKRRQLHNTLAAGVRQPVDVVKKILVEAGFDTQKRAQELSIEDWIALAKTLKNHFNLGAK